MSIPKSKLSYPDCVELFDAALADEVGARLPVADMDAAYHMRTRLNMYRQLDREDNKLAFEAGVTMHGKSVYDELKVRIKKSASGIYIYVEHVNLAKGAIQSLSEVKEEATVENKLGNPQVLSAIVDGFRRRA